MSSVPLSPFSSNRLSVSDSVVPLLFSSVGRKYSSCRDQVMASQSKRLERAAVDQWEEVGRTNYQCQNSKASGKRGGEESGLMNEGEMNRKTREGGADEGEEKSEDRQKEGYEVLFEESICIENRGISFAY
jgi:hypothetical protein